MKHFVLSDPQKEMHWVVKVVDPEQVTIPKRGELQVRLEVIGFCKGYNDAAPRALKEQLKATKG